MFAIKLRRPFYNVSTVAAWQTPRTFYWVIWLCAITFIALVYMATLGIAPLLYMDEVLTVELGRTILHPHTNWSIAWMLHQNQPAFFPFYLGPVLLEVSYQALGEYGPRMLTFLGAIVAATIMVHWMVARGVSGKISAVLGIVFLLDPLFVQAYTLGRVDGWCMALCFSACLLLLQARNVITNFSRNKLLFFAGAVTSLAFLVWPSAIFLLPLILLQLYQCIAAQKKPDAWLDALLPIALFGIGGLLASFVVLLPVLPRLYYHIGNVMQGLAINSSPASAPDGASFLFSRLLAAVELMRALKFDLVLVLAAFYALLKTRDIGLMLALCVAAILMLFTVVYINRVVYLVPYFSITVSGLFQPKRQYQNNKTLFPVNTLFLAAALLWCFGLSIVARTVLALSNRTDGNREVLGQAAVTMVGARKASVLLLDAQELYYAGRSQGWGMYAPYNSISGSVSAVELKLLLQTVDYAIISRRKLTRALDSQLQVSGLKQQGLYSLYSMVTAAHPGPVTNENRLRNLYRIPEKPYGPYCAYVRTKQQRSVSTTN